MEIPLSFLGRFREVLDSSKRQEWSAWTDEQGLFLMEGAPGLSCAKLVAWSGHTKSDGVAVPDRDALDLELVLSLTDEQVLAPGPHVLHILGQVRHSDGRLATGALVGLAGFRTLSDEQGLFELHVPDAGPGRSMTFGGAPGTEGNSVTIFGSDGLGSPEARQLVAVLTGEQAAVYVPERDAEGEELWPSFVALWLGGEPESIAGRVLGTDGLPLADATVWVDDLTFVGATHDGFLTLEHLMAGKSDQWMDRWLSARTDGEGRFEVGGLCDRDYVVAAMDPATLQIARTGAVPAGSAGVEIALRPSGIWELVEGRVVDSRGRPLAGVRIQPFQHPFSVHSFRGDVWREREERPAVLTDGAGGFRFERVPREGVVLQVSGHGIPRAERELRPDDDPLGILFEMPWLGRVQIELAGGAPEQGRIEILDALEEPLEFYVFSGGDVWYRSGIDLANEDEFAGGRTPVLSVPEGARSAVLRDANGAELRRAALALGEELATVRL